MFYRQRRQQRDRATDPNRFKPGKRTELLGGGARGAGGSAGKKKGLTLTGGGAAGGRKKAAGATGNEPLPANSPWRVEASRFPHGGSVGDKLRFALKYAVLAPSSHNTQPWKFRVAGSAVEVHADRTRALPVCDPEDRELTISVGCAVHHLEAALRRFGVASRVSAWPDAKRPDLVARVGVPSGAAGVVEPTLEEIRLGDAIADRRTIRRAFEDREVPPGAVRAMVEAARAHGATLAVVDDAETRFRLAKLVAEADLVQLCNRGFRRELALWMHHNRTHSPDGIPGYALGMTELQSVVAPLAVRTFDMGNSRAARDEELALHSPVLAVLSTDRDGAGDWVAAGRALSAVLLTATRERLGASYLNQPVEIPETRMRLKQLVTPAMWPQIVLRVGYAGGGLPAHTPRRGVKDVMLG